jgi:hypothetical protein
MLCNFLKHYFCSIIFIIHPLKQTKKMKKTLVLLFITVCVNYGFTQEQTVFADFDNVNPQLSVYNHPNEERQPRVISVEVGNHPSIGTNNKAAIITVGGRGYGVVKIPCSFTKEDNYKAIEFSIQADRDFIFIYKIKGTNGSVLESPKVHYKKSDKYQTIRANISKLADGNAATDIVIEPDPWGAKYSDSFKVYIDDVALLK